LESRPSLVDDAVRGGRAAAEPILAGDEMDAVGVLAGRRCNNVFAATS
jgi:hypothetical protein